MSDWGERPPGDPRRRGRRARPAVDEGYGTPSSYSEDASHTHRYADDRTPDEPPVNGAPANAQPAYDQPTYDQPAYDQPTYGSASGDPYGQPRSRPGRRARSQGGSSAEGYRGDQGYAPGASESVDDAFGAPWSYGPAPAEPPPSQPPWMAERSAAQPYAPPPPQAAPEPPAGRAPFELESGRSDTGWYDRPPQRRRDVIHPIEHDLSPRGFSPAPPQSNSAPVQEPKVYDAGAYDSRTYDSSAYGPNTYDRSSYDRSTYDVGPETRRSSPGERSYGEPRRSGYDLGPEPQVHDSPPRPQAQPHVNPVFDHSGLFRPEPPPSLDVRAPEPARALLDPQQLYRPEPEPTPGRDDAGSSSSFHADPTPPRPRRPPREQYRTEAPAEPETRARRSRSRSAAPDDVDGHRGRSRTTPRAAARTVTVAEPEVQAGGAGVLTALPGSLQLRVVLATAGLVCVLASVLSFDSARALSKNSDEAVQREMLAIGRTFSQGLVAGGGTEPREILQQAQDLALQEGLDRVQVYDVDTNPKSPSVTLVTSSDGVSSPAKLGRDNADAWTMLAGTAVYRVGPCMGEAAQPGDQCGIVAASAPTGDQQPTMGVLIQKNLTEAQELVARSERRAAVGVAGMTGAVGFGLAWMLRAWIFHRVRRLELVLRSVAAGRSDQRLNWKPDDELGALAAEVDAVADKMEQSQQSLHNLALEDPLTGLPNRRAGMSSLAGEVSAAQREDKPLAVVVFEVSDLAMIGERYGQEALADTLRKLGDAVRLSLRPSDVCAHLTIDRFLLVLRGSDARSAHTAVDRIREVMTRVRVGPSGGLRLTAGVVESWAGGDPQELVSRAEEELELSRRRATASY